jgi:hypothetical protein
MPIVLDGTTGITTPALENDGVTTVAPGSAAAPAITTDGDTNTGIFFPGADRIGFAEGGVQVGEFDASGNFRFNSGYGSAAVAYGCRAWVNFNGTGTVAIRASGNVSSITDNGTGDYTVNFTTAMPDTNYIGIGTQRTAATGSILYPATTETAPTTGAMRFYTVRSDTAVVTDPPWVFISFFR